MSLLPSLRYSASISTATRSATLLSLRYASTTTQPKPKSKLTKELELEAEEQRQMLARAARSNPGVDLSAQKLPLFGKSRFPNLSRVHLYLHASSTNRGHI